MKKRGRPTGRLYRETIPVRLTPESVAEIDRWMGQQAEKMFRSEAIRQLLRAALNTSARRKLGKAQPVGSGTATLAGAWTGLPATDSDEDRAGLMRALANLKTRERSTKNHSRWSKELREPIRIPSSSILELLYKRLPVEGRAWYYAYEQRLLKLAALKKQLGVDAFWEVALWFAKREVPGFRVDHSQSSGRRIPWRQRRINLYAEVNTAIAHAIDSGKEKSGAPKAIERAIEKIKEIDPLVYRRHSPATLRKQYFLAKAELKTRRG